MSAKTMFEKIWDAHVVDEEPDGTALLYIDRHLVHEVTSPQAFEGLKQTGRKPRRPTAVLAVPDHNVPTTDRRVGIPDPMSHRQIQMLEDLIKGTEPAFTNFKAMSPSVRKNYTGLYFDAKSDDAKQRRLVKIIDRLNQNLKPM